MDEPTAAGLSDWAERQMVLTTNSASALNGASAAEFGRATITAALDEPHVPAEPDPDIGAVLERIRREIAAGERDGREVTPGDSPCPEPDETS